MEALVVAMRGDFPARPCLVLSNDPDAKGLAKAEALGVPTAVVDHRSFGKDRAAFETALAARLDQAKPDIICLAGFMRVLGPTFVRAYSGRVLNIHPSLLPKYPGLHTHERALAADDALAGCTIHLVTEELDGGPILAQASIKIEKGETPEALARRVLAVEHRLYPATLARFARGDQSRHDWDAN